MNTYQVVQLVDSGYRLPPPPGCPRVIYELMMYCWSVLSKPLKYYKHKNNKKQHFHRHPESSGRLGFSDVLCTLMQNEEVILAVPESTNAQAGTLGVDLEAAYHLYSDLQHMYTMYTGSPI